MAELALLGKVGVAVLLTASIVRGFTGTPARARHPAAARVVLMTAASLYAAAATTLIAGDGVLAALFAVLGVEAACLSAWLSRARDDEGGDDDGGGGGPGPDDGGRPAPQGPLVDWAAFDRARAGWERPRIPAG